MNFSFSGILAVLSHAIPPFLPQILAILGLLVLSQLIGRLRGYRFTPYRCRSAGIVALLTGLTSLWWLPLLTHSRLGLVATVTDWVALVTAALGVSLITWLVVHPLGYLVRGPREP